MPLDKFLWTSCTFEALRFGVQCLAQTLVRGMRGN